MEYNVRGLQWKTNESGNNISYWYNFIKMQWRNTPFFGQSNVDCSVPSYLGSILVSIYFTCTIKLSLV